MAKEYFVLHKRDVKGEGNFERKRKHGQNDAPYLAEGRMLYDKYRSFNNIDKAVSFALELLHEQPILCYRGFTYHEPDKIKDKTRPFVIAAYFPSKYKHHCYDGSSDSVPTYEVISCKQEELESKIAEFGSECPGKIHYGIELKLLELDVHDNLNDCDASNL